MAAIACARYAPYEGLVSWGTVATSGDAEGKSAELRRLSTYGTMDDLSGNSSAAAHHDSAVVESRAEAEMLNDAAIVIQKTLRGRQSRQQGGKGGKDRGMSLLARSTLWQGDRLRLAFTRACAPHVLSDPRLLACTAFGSTAVSNLRLLVVATAVVRFGCGPRRHASLPFGTR